MSFDLSKCERNAQGHWLCQTRRGYAVRIICTDRVESNTNQKHPLVALLTRSDGSEDMYAYRSDGSFNGLKDHSLDLVNTTRKFRFERWVNVYEDQMVAGYCSKEAADRGAGNLRIACIPIIIEGEYGQGLEEGK